MPITVGWNSNPQVTRIMRNFRDERYSGNAVSISGWTIKLIVKRLPTDSDDNALFDLTAQIVSPSTGTYRYNFTPDHTAIQPGTYFAEERWWTSYAANKAPTDRRTESFVVQEPVQREL